MLEGVVKIFNRIAKEGITRKASFEKCRKGTKGMSHMAIWWKNNSANVQEFEGIDVSS